MENKTFKSLIDSAPEQVWNTLLGENTYPQWTSVFAEDSRVETDWHEGSRAFFLDGNGNGLGSVIAQNIPNQFLSIKHLTEFKEGVEYDNASWSGAMENYTLKELNGKTELVVEMDISEECIEYFNTAWPKALEKVKELAEK